MGDKTSTDDRLYYPRHLSASSDKEEQYHERQ
jgi:hypothetical protein